MRLYDEGIKNILRLLEACTKKSLLQNSYAEERLWEDAGDMNLILRHEMAYELGNGTLPAVSAFGFTSDKRLVCQDEILLYGPDLDEIKEHTPFGKVTLIGTEEGVLGEGEEAFDKIRQIEYIRYHVNPKGFMMRISTSGEREPVRIGRNAVEEGLSFEKVGRLFLEAYKKNNAVRAVKQIFITDPRFDYEALGAIAHRAEEITRSLNKILQDFNVDCSSCNLKPICDQVDGMRELHFAQAEGRKKYVDNFDVDKLNKTCLY